MQVKKETPQAYQLRMQNLNHVKGCLNMINQERVKARYVFEHLLPGQKKYLLQASGIQRSVSAINQLSDFEVEKLQKGLFRIKSILDAFNSCTDKDFQTAQKKQKAA